MPGMLVFVFRDREGFDLKFDLAISSVVTVSHEKSIDRR